MDPKNNPLIPLENLFRPQIAALAPLGYFLLFHLSDARPQSLKSAIVLPFGVSLRSSNATSGIKKAYSTINNRSKKALAKIHAQGFFWIYVVGLKINAQPLPIELKAPAIQNTATFAFHINQYFCLTTTVAFEPESAPKKGNKKPRRPSQVTGARAARRQQILGFSDFLRKPAEIGETIAYPQF